MLWSPALGLQIPFVSFHMDSEDLNSGPPACEACTLPTEPSPQFLTSSSFSTKISFLFRNIILGCCSFFPLRAIISLVRKTKSWQVHFSSLEFFFNWFMGTTGSLGIHTSSSLPKWMIILTKSRLDLKAEMQKSAAKLSRTQSKTEESKVHVLFYQTELEVLRRWARGNGGNARKDQMPLWQNSIRATLSANSTPLKTQCGWK